MLIVGLVVGGVPADLFHRNLPAEQAFLLINGQPLQVELRHQLHGFFPRSRIEKVWRYGAGGTEFRAQHAVTAGIAEHRRIHCEINAVHRAVVHADAAFWIPAGFFDILVGQLDMRSFRAERPSAALVLFAVQFVQKILQAHFRRLGQGRNQILRAGIDLFAQTGHLSPPCLGLFYVDLVRMACGGVGVGVTGNVGVGIPAAYTQHFHLALHQLLSNVGREVFAMGPVGGKGNGVLSSYVTQALDE